jgi:ABC-type antimicrobial peptide transport system permease subunit
LLGRLHAQVGSQVRVAISAIQGAPTRTFTVVGVAIAPWADQSGSFTGGGAVMTHTGFERLLPAHGVGVPPSIDAFVGFSPGAMTPAHLSQLRHQVGDEYQVLLPQPPTDLLNFGRVRNLPLVLALLLVGLATVTLFLTLLSSATRRRSEMAVLKALGYRPGQLQGVVAWQSTAMTVVGLVVGLPLGVALGRWLWIVVADHLALLGQPVVPAWQIALVGVGALVLANVASAWPGLIVARTPVTRILRSA